MDSQKAALREQLLNQYPALRELSEEEVGRMLAEGTLREVPAETRQAIAETFADR